MAKKKASNNGDRQDPRNNKSLAIRTILEKMPDAKASDVVDAVKNEFGHDIGKNLVYMVKTKGNMASDAKAAKGAKSKASAAKSPLTTAALWVDAIKSARQLVKATGSVANAIALVKALGDS
jgi:hypothetical protein